ncbi:HAD family hydrolase [Planctomycetales bacterium ZRK34]|nr:HAD family hydrolase [Planctomycetales bacterium ZRK34]
MSPRPIIFDLDGTLLNTLTDIANAANFAMAQLGQPTHPVADFRRMVGDGADVLMQRALPDDQQALCAEALELFKQHYMQHLYDNTEPYDGIVELLGELARREHPIAVLTNKPHTAAVQMVERVLGQFPWTFVAGHRDGIAKKPDAAPAIDVATRCGATPEVCCFVGDSNTDMRTAVNAKMIGVGVTWGFRDREELLAEGATHVIDHPSQLLAIIGE